MANKTSPLIKGAWWSSGFVHLILKEMRDQGMSDEMVEALIDSNPEHQPIKNIVENMKKFPSELYAPNLIPAGYRVLEDVAPHQFEMEDLELVPIVEHPTPFIPGEEMRMLAEDCDANFGLADVKRILERNDKIPVQWRKFHLVLSGTLVFDPRDKGKRLKVGVLHYENVLWLLDFLWLGPGWYNYQRLLRVKAK